MDVSGYWRYSRGYVGGFVAGLKQPVPETPPVPDLEDPEALLNLAQQEMKENQAKNRERAVQAITQKNNLQAEVDKTQKMVNNLQAKAELARSKGDLDLERQILLEKERCQITLSKMATSLTTSITIVEEMKEAMRREEERIRSKTAQAMALKTEWKQIQILSAIELSAATDAEAILKPMHYEVQAFVAQANRVSNELWQQAERALRSGNRALARTILMERAAFHSAFSNSV